jgi:hypothetical protein
LTPNPIRKALSTIRQRQVRHLLMGGQACVLYGAAEFSRDADLAITTNPDNLDRLHEALADLDAEIVAVPPFAMEYLDRGHAVHFRCRHPAAKGVRVDLMSVMRGVDPFEKLWERRTTIETDDGDMYDLLSLPDLVQSKKTQRDKDWPMVRRLVEASYFQHRASPSPEQLNFWLQELRTPALLIELVHDHAEVARERASQRPLLEAALANDAAAVEAGLSDEEQREREADRVYWRPLRAELEALRRTR